MSVVMSAKWLMPRQRGTSSMFTTFTVQMNGKVVVVTGANSGIGKETAVALAAMGATTVLACRNPEKAAAAATEVRERAASDAVGVVALDLADLATVRTAAATIEQTWGRLDV